MELCRGGEESMLEVCEGKGRGKGGQGEEDDLERDGEECGKEKEER